MTTQYNTQFFDGITKKQITEAMRQHNIADYPKSANKINLVDFALSLGEETLSKLWPIESTPEAKAEQTDTPEAEQTDHVPAAGEYYTELPELPTGHDYVYMLIHNRHAETVKESYQTALANFEHSDSIYAKNLAIWESTQKELLAKLESAQKELQKQQEAEFEKMDKTDFPKVMVFMAACEKEKSELPELTPIAQHALGKPMPPTFGLGYKKTAPTKGNKKSKGGKVGLSSLLTRELAIEKSFATYRSAGDSDKKLLVVSHSSKLPHSLLQKHGIQPSDDTWVISEVIGDLGDRTVDENGIPFYDTTFSAVQNMWPMPLPKFSGSGMNREVTNVVFGEKVNVSAWQSYGAMLTEPIYPES